MKGFTYLAGPYTHDLEFIRRSRFNSLTKKAAELMRMGFVVFSPITHGHTIATAHDLPYSFDFWKIQCLTMLNHADRLVVLEIEGYTESKGVLAEVLHAESLNIPVEYMKP